MMLSTSTLTFISNFDAIGFVKHIFVPRSVAVERKITWKAKTWLDNCRYNDYRYHVRKTGKSKPIKNEHERTFVTLLRVTDMLSRRPAQLLKKEDLSMNQYNVLRILRGAPDGLPCGEISNRMITRDPDITRLLDRLEKRGFISRSRESKDRRTVTARLTSEGYALLARLDETVQDTHRQQLGHLSEKRLRELSDLLTACCDRLA